jgi:hypothetical protein
MGQGQLRWDSLVQDPCMTEQGLDFRGEGEGKLGLGTEQSGYASAEEMIGTETTRGQ